MKSSCPPDSPARLALAFSCIGHTCSHLFAPIFFVVVLALESEFGLDHGRVVALVLAGTVLYGVAAPLAGWLGDRWSATGMMAVFFLGTGAGMMSAGAARSPAELAVALAFTGLFGSIYHPVGIAWLVRNARSRGKALGMNGVFGAAGPASGALAAGFLVEAAGWRTAFLVPGAIVFGIGVAFCALRARGRLPDRAADLRPEPAAPRRDAVRAFVVLSLTMLCGSLIYQATQPALPKLFAERGGDLLAGGVFGAALLVTLVYTVSGAMQIVAGYLADRYPLKTVYIACLALQAPALLLAGSLGGEGLLLAAMLMVTLNVGALPAENGLVARYSPSDRRGLAFGLKFVLAFGISGLGVQLEASLFDLTGGFEILFVVLAALALSGFVAACLLPDERAPALRVRPVEEGAG